MSSPSELTARALLFDMDGTLVDSTAVVETVWIEFADRFGLDRRAVLGSIHGVRAEESVLRWAPEGTDVAAIVRELNAYEIAHADDTVALPGAAEFLAALPSDAVALVTSANPALAAARMSGAGLTVPATLVSAADVERGKPEPDGYLLAAARLGVDPADALVFEDAEAGIRAGLRAGMRVVVVGEHESETTAGLPRIVDYARARVAHEGDGLRVSL
jgi:mannitol-1-/sugar-/sorbitol-6-phosphatase